MGYPFYPSEISLMLTRFAPIGSVEATQFVFSDDTPVANQKVTVATAIENTGLTTAEGCDIKIYEYKDGQRGKEIYSTASDDPLRVNTAKKITFDWTIPADGPEGYCLQTVTREKKADGGYYDAIENFSDPFELKPEYEPVLDECVQNGDGFDVKFHVTNTGNEPAPEGITTSLVLQALHGDLQERYGMDTDLLITEDISGLAPGETKEVEKTITLPVSVFRFCGYDAVAVSVLDKDEEMLATTDQELIVLAAPINLKLNGGKSMTMDAGETKQAVLTYDSTVFIDIGGGTIFSVADPSIASVDAEGNVIGLAGGSTTLTVTMLPSGRSVSIPVTVKGAGEEVDKSKLEQAVQDAEKVEKDKYTAESVAALEKALAAAKAVLADDAATQDAVDAAVKAVKDAMKALKEKKPFRFDDVQNEKAFYFKAVYWAYEHAPQITKGTTATTFSPNDTCTRGQVVTFLWRAAGCPEPKDTQTPFTDLKPGAFYTKAVAWAVEQNITKGTSATTFSPDQGCTRGQVVTFLHRFEHTPKPGSTNNPFNDVKAGRFYYDAVLWAVEQGVTKGTTGVTFSPDDTCTRGQIVTFLYRAMK